jgi:hypothetical protein
MDTDKKAMRDLIYVMNHPWATQHHEAWLMGHLTGQRLAEGLHSSNPLVHQQALNTKQAWLDSLANLPDKAREKGYHTGLALIEGLRLSGVLDKVAGLFGLGGASVSETVYRQTHHSYHNPRKH